MTNISTTHLSLTALFCIIMLVLLWQYTLVFNYYFWVTCVLLLVLMFIFGYVFLLKIHPRVIQKIEASFPVKVISIFDDEEYSYPRNLWKIESLEGEKKHTVSYWYSLLFTLILIFIVMIPPGVYAYLRMQ